MDRTNPHDSEHEYLFRQMDDIVADTQEQVQAEEVVAAEEIRRKQEQYERQMELVVMIAEMVDPETAQALYGLYEEEDPEERLLGEDVDAVIREQLARKDLPDDARNRFVQLEAFNDLIWEGSLVALEDGEYEPMYDKAYLQASILRNDVFSLELKLELAAELGNMLPGDSIDPELELEALTTHYGN